MLRSKLPLTLLALALWASILSACSRGRSLNAFEGRITMHTTRVGGDTHDITVATKGTKLRFDMVTSTGKPTHATYDGAGAESVFFLDATKQYMSLGFSSPKSAANAGPPPGTATAAGVHKVVAGYGCDVWSVKEADGHRADVCLAGGIAYVDPAHLRSGSRQPETMLAREYREKKAFPLQSVEYDADGKEVSRMQVVKVEPAVVADSEFAIPPDYTRLDASPERR